MRDSRGRSAGAVDEDVVGQRIDAERIAVPDHDVPHFSGLECAGPLEHPDRLRGIRSQPLDGPFGGDRQTRALSVGDRFCGFLVETLYSFRRVGMDDCAAIGRRVHECDVFRNSVVGLHFEAPPVRPHGRAHPALGQQVGDLVCLDGVMERRDVVAKLLRHVEDRRHLIGAIAVHVHDDLALQYRRQRIEFDIALRRLRVLVAGGVFLVIFLLIAQILLRLYPLIAVAGDIAHARGGERIALAVDPLWDFRRRPSSGPAARREISFPGR